MDARVCKRKSSYCRGSKLSDPVFEIILFGFLSGQSTSQTKTEIAEKFNLAPPTEKTVGRHYDRIGLALFDRTYGKEWHRKYPHLDNLKQKDLVEYQLAIDKLSDAYHFEALNPLDPQYAQPVEPGKRPWGETLEAKEYRTFSAKRFGIRYRARGHLALARFRAAYHSEVEVIVRETSESEARRVAKTLSLQDGDLQRLYDHVLDMFRKVPC